MLIPVFHSRLNSIFCHKTFLSGHVLSRIYNCTKPGYWPIDNAATAQLHCTFYNCTNCDQLHVKICPVSCHLLAAVRWWDLGLFLSRHCF